MQSFAFSFRLSKVGSLIEWLLRSFFVHRENPMLRIFNTLSSCCDVDVLLQGDCREVNLPATEPGPKLREKFTNFQTVKNAKNSNFSSSICHGSNLLTRTKATSLPVSLNKNRTASQFEDRHDSQARRFLRMLVLFVVLLVDHEEWFYILAESLSHIRRAIFCILVLLKQSQVVDVMVVEHRLDSI